MRSISETVISTGEKNEFFLSRIEIVLNSINLSARPRLAHTWNSPNPVRKTIVIHRVPSVFNDLILKIIQNTEIAIQTTPNIILIILIALLFSLVPREK